MKKKLKYGFVAHLPFVHLQQTAKNIDERKFIVA